MTFIFRVISDIGVIFIKGVISLMEWQLSEELCFNRQLSLCSWHKSLPQGWLHVPFYVGMEHACIPAGNAAFSTYAKVYPKFTSLVYRRIKTISWPSGSKKLQDSCNYCKTWVRVLRICSAFFSFLILLLTALLGSFTFQKKQRCLLPERRSLSWHCLWLWPKLEVSHLGFKAECLLWRGR